MIGPAVSEITIPIGTGTSVLFYWDPPSFPHDLAYLSSSPIFFFPQLLMGTMLKENEHAVYG
jgi:hypothetical protein